LPSPGQSIILLVSLLLAIWLAGCSPPQATQTLINVTIVADDQTLQESIQPGSTVQQALNAANLELGSLDRTDPALFTLLTEGAEVRLIRVTEKFEVVQTVVPFEHQTLRNESLPQGKENEVYLQNGKNGVQEITYRKVYEDGVEVSSSPIKSAMLEEPVPEIVMIGIQAPLVPVAVPGRLIYLRDGNAWMIEESTGNRRAVVTTGDLDGRVLTVSDDKDWLLFTRRSDSEDEINALWVMDIRDETGKMIDLKVSNVVHFADWVPNSNSKVIFSTVEPRSTAPGWQANNDLNVFSVSPSGWTSKKTVILEPNSGGVYGWWGSSFTWSPDRQTLAIARPDGISLVDFYSGEVQPVADVIPLQTRGDWAWVPAVAWSPDGRTIYTIDHVSPPGSLSAEESPIFNLSALPMGPGGTIQVVSQAGMFAYPIVSPITPRANGELAYEVAYLQAIFPTQSDTSRYRLTVMDRDGSNRRVLFPTEGSSGLGPQQGWGAWSPEPLPDSGHFSIALIYQGNLWLVDTVTGQGQQVTGDGLTTRVIWK
jgi:hypothetical protein